MSIIQYLYTFIIIMTTSQKSNKLKFLLKFPTNSHFNYNFPVNIIFQFPDSRNDEVANITESWDYSKLTRYHSN